LSLRYSITNAKEHNRNRVFYVTAFLTVLEQNAADIRSILLMDDVILEHHSNFVEDTDIIFENEYDKAEYNPQAYLKESWENPIILTTMVQFLNTLFKERASNIRRFCKLINSVIIIDEVQSLPLKVLSNFNLMMNFMKEIMHCNIVHCTATQPVLDSKAMTYPIYYGNEEDQFASIINIETKLLECFHRVDFYNLTGNNANLLLSTEKISDYIQKELMLFNTCLVVLNTKAAVLKLYDYLIKNISGVEVIYLTTNLCAAHRLNVISSMKEKLKYNRNESGQHKLICVSTQLIEAGVDVDFDIVFRSLSGVDSIIQCAGRCNREGKLEFEGKMVHGKLFIMRYSEENLSYLPDIKASVDATEYAIRSVVEQEDDSLTIERLQLPYFNKYYISNRDKLDYVDMKKGSNMVEELGKNDPDRYAYTIAKKPNKKHMMFQAFLRAAENFHLIDEGTTAIIVPYQNQELLQNLHLAMNKKDYRRIKEILKKLQRYSVNVYLSPKLEPYIYKNEEYNIYFLSEPYYHENKGISTVGLADLIY
jgi:CRISPR-associated endonuclease/helicase Cas3